MRTFFLRQMAMYSAYHRHPQNRRLHQIGVPSIVLGLLIGLGRPNLGWWGFYPVSAGTALAAAAMLYWIALDRRLGGMTSLLLLALLPLSGWISTWPGPMRSAAFALFFVGGWIVQLVGHRIEGRKPALLDNPAQGLIAPLFVTLETLHPRGLFTELHEAVEARWTAFR